SLHRRIAALEDLLAADGGADVAEARIVRDRHQPVVDKQRGHRYAETKQGQTNQRVSIATEHRCLHSKTSQSLPYVRRGATWRPFAVFPQARATCSSAA